MGASSSFDYARSSNTTRNHSPIIWNQCDVDSLRRGIDGYLFEDDFFDLPTGKYTATQATSGTFALGNLEGGVALADSGATTDNQGINVQLGGTAGASFVAPALGLLLFEARVKISTAMSSGPQFFAGLWATDTTIIASGALSTSATYCGFSSVTDDGVLLGASGNGTTAETASSIKTLVADTYVWLGFIIKDRTTITFYVDGVKKDDTNTVSIPTTTAMRPSFVCQSSGTLQPIMSIDRFRCAVSNAAL